MMAMTNPPEKAERNSALLLRLSFPHIITFDNHNIKKNACELHVPGSFYNIYILNHSNFEANNSHRHVNCTVHFKN